MSFNDNNKYFIFHNLNREMKGLTDTEKRKKYENIKKEVRTRVKESYSRIINKGTFYQEIFEALSFYEADYLMINLFYEDDAVSIIGFLYKNKLFDGLVLSNTESITYKYYTFLLSRFSCKGNYNNEDEVEFLKVNILNYIKNISDHDWKEKDGKEGGHPMVSKYSKWIAYNLHDKINYPNLLGSFMCFVKVWNYYDIFSKPFNNTKAILFYTHIISPNDNEDSKIGNLYEFVNELSRVFSDLFVNIKYVPLIDERDSINYKAGYVLKRKELNNTLKRAEKLISLNNYNSILNLFVSIDLYTEPMILEKIQTIIKKKLNNHEIPSYGDLIEIKELKLIGEADQIRQNLFERLYLFELIKFD